MICGKGKGNPAIPKNQYRLRLDLVHALYVSCSGCVIHARIVQSTTVYLVEFSEVFTILLNSALIVQKNDCW